MWLVLSVEDSRQDRPDAAAPFVPAESSCCGQSSATTLNPASSMRFKAIKVLPSLDDGGILTRLDRRTTVTRSVTTLVGSFTGVL